LSWAIASLIGEIKRERLYVWGVRSGTSIIDQGLTSVAGLLISLLLARWLSGESYGAFAVIYATVLFLFGFHSVLILEPMSVFGPASHAAQITDYMLAQMKVHAIASAVLSGAMLVAGLAMKQFGIHRELVSAILGGALAIPFLFFVWLVRRMCYVIHRPSVAVRGSAIYLLMIVIGLAAMRATGWLSPCSAFLLMGVAGLLSVLWMLQPLGLLRASRNGCSWSSVWRQNWRYGKWLVASTALFSVASQAQTYVAAAMVGLSAAGILRATMIPSLVMTQIVTATALLVLPSMAADYGNGRIGQLRKKAVLCTISLTAIAAVYAGILAAFSQPIERLLFGDKFAAYAALISILALVPVCSGFGLGFAMAVRACQKPHYDLIANAVSAPVGLVTALVFIHFWGITGAAVSLVVASACYGLVFYWAFVRDGRRIAAPLASACAGLGRADG
jgi:O-antigen/teichoic acid export membrane protein